MSEYLAPTHDQVLLKALVHEDVTEGGIIIPGAGDYDDLKSDRERQQHTPDRDIQKNKRRNTNRYEVLEVGPGSYVDVADDIRDRVFLRKPMCCAKGDVVLVQEGAVPVPVDGEILYMAHDWLVLAKVIKGEDGKEVIEPLHDYVFAKPADAVQKSKGGIYMASQDDHTGNQSLPDRWETLGVGEGPWALCQKKGKIPEFARRPMTVAPGDVFAFEGAGFWVAAMGAPMCVVQDYQIAGVFKPQELVA